MKSFGPVQAYVALATVGVESEIVAPAQYGPPFEAVGVAGVGFTTTVVVPAAEVQPLTVMVTEYVPPCAVEVLTRVGFCREEVKPLGPVHEYVAPATVGVLSEIVPPTQYGPLLLTKGVDGTALTMTFVVPAAEGQPLMVIVTE